MADEPEISVAGSAETQTEDGVEKNTCPNPEAEGTSCHPSDYREGWVHPPVPDRALSKSVSAGIVVLALVAGALAGGCNPGGTPDKQLTILTGKLETAIAERNALENQYKAALAERNTMRDEVVVRQARIDRNQLELANKLLLQQLTDEKAHANREILQRDKVIRERDATIQKRDKKIKDLNDGLKASLAALKAETARIAKHQKDRDNFLGSIDGR